MASSSTSRSQKQRERDAAELEAAGIFRQLAGRPPKGCTGADWDWRVGCWVPNGRVHIPALSLNVADARKRVRERLKLSIPKCEWRVHEVAAKGDCFFLCIALARESLGFEMVLDMKASAMRVRARLCDFAEQHPEQAARFAIHACLVS